MTWISSFVLIPLVLPVLNLQLHTTAHLALNKHVPSLFCASIIHSLFLRHPPVTRLLESFRPRFQMISRPWSSPDFSAVSNCLPVSISYPVVCLRLSHPPLLPLLLAGTDLSVIYDPQHRSLHTIFIQYSSRKYLLSKNTNNTKKEHLSELF